jgi:phage gpG-like protein
VALEWNGPAVIAALQKAAFRGVVRGTESVKTRMVERILQPPKTGRVYKRNTVSHQASAPGESPASDTGRLAQSVTTTYDIPNITGYVNVSTEYAEGLEFGTPRVAPRPYARVSLAEKTEEIRADIAAEIAGALR